MPNQSPVPNIYKILGVREDAPLKEISGAFRKFSKENHPDTLEGENPARVRLYKEVSGIVSSWTNQAIPKDERKNARVEYDRSLRNLTKANGFGRQSYRTSEEPAKPKQRSESRHTPYQERKKRMEEFFLEKRFNLFKDFVNNMRTLYPGNMEEVKKRAWELFKGDKYLTLFWQYRNASFSEFSQAKEYGVHEKGEGFTGDPLIEISRTDLALIKAIAMFHGGKIPIGMEAKIKRDPEDKRGYLNPTAYIVTWDGSRITIKRNISDLLQEDKISIYTGKDGKLTQLHKNLATSPRFWEEAMLEGKITNGKYLRNAEEYYASILRIGYSIGKQNKPIKDAVAEEARTIELFYENNPHLYGNDPRKELLGKFRVEDLPEELNRREVNIEISPTREGKVR